MTDTKIILEIDKPNKNGRIYTKQAIEDAIGKLNGRPVIGYLGMSSDDTPNISNASHYIDDLRIEDDKLIGTIKIIDQNENGKLLKLMMDNEISFAYRSAGYGNIIIQDDGTKLIEEFTIISINAVNEKDDDWLKNLTSINEEDAV